MCTLFALTCAAEIFTINLFPSYRRTFHTVIQHILVEKSNRENDKTNKIASSVEVSFPDIHTYIYIYIYMYVCISGISQEYIYVCLCVCVYIYVCQEGRFLHWMYTGCFTLDIYIYNWIYIKYIYITGDIYIYIYIKCCFFLVSHSCLLYFWH